MSDVQPLAIDRRALAQLQSLELRLAPGRVIAARVLEAADPAGRGRLAIAGTAIEAQLPANLRTGEPLRLLVRSADSQRVVLELAHAAPAAAPAPPPAAVALPGDGMITVDPDDEGRGATLPAAGAQSVALRYDAPALGALDLRFELTPRTLKVVIAAPAGAPTELARAHADELQATLAGLDERQVQVTVAGRRDPLDLYA